MVLTTRQLLERANFHIENAWKTNDTGLASVLCDDAVSTLSRVKWTVKLTPKYSGDNDLRMGIATASQALGKLQEKLGKSADAQFSYGKAEKWK